MGIKFGGILVVKFGFTGFALAGCLSLTSYNATSGILPSAFDYPEAKAYVDCVVAHTRKRALDKGKQLRNSDVHDVTGDAFDDCEAAEMQVKSHMRANGLSDIRVNDLLVELRTKAWDLAWDEFARIRLAQLKAQGAIR